jgi:hypothetical protein
MAEIKARKNQKKRQHHHQQIKNKRLKYTASYTKLLKGQPHEIIIFAVLLQTAFP